MPNNRELRRRIRSVKNTSQITKAMQMVAATKMRRAQNQALSGRPYLEELRIGLHNLLASLETPTHPFLTPNTASNALVLVLSTDKSLCGSLNSNLFRRILMLKEEIGKEVTYYTIGRKAREFVIKTGRTLEGDFVNDEVITFGKASGLQKVFSKLFLENNFSDLYILYPHFVSTLVQEPKLVRVLPVEEKSLLTENGDETNKEYIFEPNYQFILDYLLKHYLDVVFYQTMLETKASEHSARMIAMKNATDNANELREELTLNYNQVRQGAITNEILEIASASAALEL